MCFPIALRLTLTKKFTIMENVKKINLVKKVVFVYKSSPSKLKITTDPTTSLTNTVTTTDTAFIR